MNTHWETKSAWHVGRISNITTIVMHNINNLKYWDKRQLSFYIISLSNSFKSTPRCTKDIISTGLPSCKNLQWSSNTLKVHTTTVLQMFWEYQSHSIPSIYIKGSWIYEKLKPIPPSKLAQRSNQGHPQ